MLLYHYFCCVSRNIKSCSLTQLLLKASVFLFISAINLVEAEVFSFAFVVGFANKSLSV